MVLLHPIFGSVECNRIMIKALRLMGVCPFICSLSFRLKSLLKRDLVSDDWDSGNSSISRTHSNGAKNKSQSGGTKAPNGKKTHKRHSSSSIGSSAAISAKRLDMTGFNESGMKYGRFDG